MKIRVFPTGKEVALAAARWVPAAAARLPTLLGRTSAGEADGWSGASIARLRCRAAYFSCRTTSARISRMDISPTTPGTVMRSESTCTSSISQRARSMRNVAIRLFLFMRAPTSVGLCGSSARAPCGPPRLRGVYTAYWAGEEHLRSKQYIIHTTVRPL